MNKQRTHSRDPAPPLCIWVFIPAWEQRDKEPPMALALEIHGGVGTHPSDPVLEEVLSKRQGLRQQGVHWRKMTGVRRPGPKAPEQSVGFEEGELVRSGWGGM